MAKLHFRNEVKQNDVDEAIKLMDYSIRSLRNSKEAGKKSKRGNKDTANDKMTFVINEVRDIMQKQKLS